MIRRILMFHLLLFVASATAAAQPEPYSMLDNRPYDPARDPDIDMYIGNWRESMPRHSHGTLIERDILTKGDQVNPEEKGAVLIAAERFCYATLQPREKTTPYVPDGEQEIFYVLTGEGTVTAGGKTAGLYSGIGVLIPEGLSFTMENTGDTELAMYMLVEACPPGFEPLSEMQVRDENAASWNAGNPHWVGMSKPLFNKGNGLATIGNIITVRFDSMTMFHPHSHRVGQEEVWTTIYGETYFLLGKEIRKQPPGTGYCIPPTGITAHSNFNVSDSMIKLFYFSKLD